MREENVVIIYNLPVALCACAKNKVANLIEPKGWLLCMVGDFARAGGPSVDPRLVRLSTDGPDPPLARKKSTKGDLSSELVSGQLVWR